MLLGGRCLLLVLVLLVLLVLLVQVLVLLVLRGIHGRTSKGVGRKAKVYASGRVHGRGKAAIVVVRCSGGNCAIARAAGEHGYTPRPRVMIPIVHAPIGAVVNCTTGIHSGGVAIHKVSGFPLGVGEVLPPRLQVC